MIWVSRGACFHPFSISNNGGKKMRKLLSSASLVGLAASVFAEGDTSTTLTSQLASNATTEIGNLSTAIGPILIAAFGIAVGFVAYKLIKRAINKA